jgi:CRISPR-associated endoribonuclease Cas6
MSAPPDSPPPLTALPLRFEATVDRPVELNEHKGSAIRGALFHALRGRPGTDRGFCLRKELPSCHPCELHAVCPISALVATVRPDSDRGADPPRPFTLEPPLSPRTHFERGEPFEFGATLFGEAAHLLPYLVAATRELRTMGIGQRSQSGIGRGTLRLQRIAAFHPLTGVTEELMEPGANVIRPPTLRVTDADIPSAVSKLGSSGQATLELLTPTRLTDGGQLVRQIAFRPLLHRLIERRLALTGVQVDTRPFWPLLEQAAAVAVEADDTHWIELDSYSTRRNARAPLSGLVGRVTFAGDLAPYLPWLVWGQVLHVGKEATKGNGWYQIA